MNQLQKLPAFPITYVQKPNAHVKRIVDGLRDAAQSKWQPVNAKLRFDAPENPYRKPVIGADVASAKADIDNAPSYTGGEAEQVNGRASIHWESALTAAELRRHQ